MIVSSSQQRIEGRDNAVARVLVVDDDPAVLRLVRDALSDTGIEIAAVASHAEASAALREDPVDVVLADLRLRGHDGLTLVAAARRADPTISTVIMTGSRDVESSVQAIRLGIDDYLLKPFTPDRLQRCLSECLAKRRRAEALRAHQAALETRAAQGESRLQAVLNRLDQTYHETVQALGAALDVRDIDTHAHSSRVAAYAGLLGESLRMDEASLATLMRGVYLHDIGKIGIPDRILLNPGSLSPADWDIMKTHCEMGFRLASRVEFLRDAGTIILAHHERYDGTGYPRGLRGRDIPFGARLFSVIDAFDAMTADRPYRPARSLAEAREEICRRSGTQFDPDIVEAFAGMPLETWRTIRASQSGGVGATPSPR